MDKKTIQQQSESNFDIKNQNLVEEKWGIKEVVLNDGDNASAHASPPSYSESELEFNSSDDDGDNDGYHTPVEQIIRRPIVPPPAPMRGRLCRFGRGLWTIEVDD